MIIAEASLQHQGNWDLARDIAWDARSKHADAVKFQLFVPDEPLFCPLKGDDERWSKWMASCMPRDDWVGVKAYCEDIGIDFMASVFQPGAVELYKSLNPKWWKVASRAARNFPYKEIGDGIPIISCGLTLPPILDQGYPSGKGKWLQCKVEYPHPPEKWSKDRWAGLSDHSGSPWPSIHALARGAEIIEVHVDFGREQKLPEEITLDELKLICEARDAFAALR